MPELSAQPQLSQLGRVTITALGLIALVILGIWGDKAVIDWFIFAFVFFVVAVALINPTRLKFKGGPLELGLEREAAQEKLEEVQAAAQEVAAEVIYKTSSDEANISESAEVQAVSVQSQEERRAAIESLITEAAEWGWLMADLGFTSPPRPNIEWIDDKPFITFAVGDPDGPKGGPLTGTAGTGHDVPGTGLDAPENK